MGGDYCWPHMPLKLALAARETLAGHRVGALGGGGRRWNPKELTWSIHWDNKKLDRAGVGTSNRFTNLPHVELENLVYFSLCTDTYTEASGHI